MFISGDTDRKSLWVKTNIIPSFLDIETFPKNRRFMTKSWKKVNGPHLRFYFHHLVQPTCSSSAQSKGWVDRSSHWHIQASFSHSVHRHWFKGYERTYCGGSNLGPRRRWKMWQWLRGVFRIREQSGSYDNEDGQEIRHQMNMRNLES